MQTQLSLRIGRWFGFLFLAACSSVAAWWLATWVAEVAIAKPSIPAGVKLPVTGVMQPEIRVFPAQVLLGPKAVGSVAETTVQLQSPPEAGWVVDRVEIDSADR